MSYFFTSESVSEGHPDKICDQISDAVLDAALKSDPSSRVACEVFVTSDFCLLGGEISTKAHLDFEKIARETIRNIGYTDPDLGFCHDTCEVKVMIHEQSGDIAKSVTKGRTGMHRHMGAGDQGMVFGYATDETDEYMPLPIMLAHRLLLKLSKVRRKGDYPFLRPDAKAQVTVEYCEDGTPLRVDTIVLSSQHDDKVIDRVLETTLQKKVIAPVCESWMDHGTKIFINPSGRFVIGGPHGDTGLTGRKIMVDTYGGMGRHGGGAFSGKDATKVDRTGAYMARYIAKNIVAAGFASRCEIQLAFAIGMPRPVSIFLDTFGTHTGSPDFLRHTYQRHFDLSVFEMIRTLDLEKPIFLKTSVYGHFGRSGFSWEKTDIAKDLR